MYITIYKHRQTMSERIQTIYKHFAVVLLNLFRQQYVSYIYIDRIHPCGGGVGWGFQIFKSIKMRRGPTPLGVGGRILIELKIWGGAVIIYYSIVL